MAYFRQRMDKETFSKNETKINCLAGVFGGVIGGFVTNGFDSIVVVKMKNPNVSLVKCAKTEGVRLLSKGLLANVYY